MSKPVTKVSRSVTKASKPTSKIPLMSNPLIPTKSIKAWFTLVNRYVNAHILNGKPITIEKAQEDLLNLYREFYTILGPYASDSRVLYKIYTIIIEYENDAFTSLARLNISSEKN
jgi:hypothetical protein